MNYESEPALNQYKTKIESLIVKNLTHHPLYKKTIRAIMTNLRNENTPPRRFRILTEQLYEYFYPMLLNWLPHEKTKLTTGTGKPYEGLDFSSAKILFVEIPRAGTDPTTKAMDYLHQIADSCNADFSIHRGVVDVSRVEEGEEVGHEVKSVEIPNLTGEVYSIMLDPMLATGGSMNETIRITNERIKSGGGEIKKLFLGSHIAVPQGIDKVGEIVNEIQVPSLLVCGTIDPKLNEDGYIVPGYGDAGDRQYNTLK